MPTRAPAPPPAGGTEEIEEEEVLYTTLDKDTAENVHRVGWSPVIQRAFTVPAGKVGDAEQDQLARQDSAGGKLGRMMSNKDGPKKLINLNKVNEIMQVRASP